MEEKIIAMLNEVNEEIMTYSGPNMVADEVVDSFELIEIISRLEDTFDIEIDAADIIEENFGNKERIIAYVKELISE